MSILKRTLFLFLTLALTLLPAAGAAQTLYPGIDVSVWQGDIDFQRVRDAGKKIVYIRAGYGQSLDTYFRANAQKARDAGLPIGFYFFVTAENPEQARAQARFFAQIIRTEAYQCRPAVDFEQYGSLSREELNTIALTFAETLEAESVVEGFLSAAVMGKLETVTIIHGKGTGALRKAVHDILRRSKAVKSFRLGVYGEGETGVTVVTMK